MSTPRELLGIRDDLAKKVAEKQLDRNDAVADLRAAAAKYPEHLDKLAEDWADDAIDRGVKKYEAKRNKADAARIARMLAELGLEQPRLDGSVPPVSQDDSRYSATLRERGEFLRDYLASSRRLVESIERQENDYELLVGAAGGDLDSTGEQALDALKRMPDAKRKALRAEVKAKLSVERRALMQQRYGDFGQAAQG